MNGIQTRGRQTPTNLKVVNKLIKPPPTPHTPLCWVPGVCVCVRLLQQPVNCGLFSKSTQKRIAHNLNTFTPFSSNTDENLLILIRHLLITAGFRRPPLQGGLNDKHLHQ